MPTRLPSLWSAALVLALATSAHAQELLHTPIPLTVRPRPAPTPDQLDALRLLTAEADAFAARAARYRADLAALADRREALFDRQRQALVVPDPPAPPPPFFPPRADLAALRELPPALPAAVAWLTAVLDRAADPRTALHVDAIESLSAILSRPTGADARCQGAVAALSGALLNARRPFACASLLRVAAPAELAAALPPAQRTPWAPLVAPDRPWRAELLQQLAADALHSGHPDEAVALLRVFLAAYPLDRAAPLARQHIIEALESAGRTELALAERLAFAAFAEGGPWFRSNQDATSFAERTADDAHDHLRQAALGRLAQADRLRASARPDEARAVAELAARALAAMIDTWPNDLDAYELRYRRAVALACAGLHDEAARAFADVRESNEDETHLAQAAHGAVEQQMAHIESLARRGEFDACVAVRAGVDPARVIDDRGQPRLSNEQVAVCERLPTGGPAAPQRVTELPIPDPVRTLMDARIAYSIRVPVFLDVIDASGPLRPRYALINARTLLRFGHVYEAEALFLEVMRIYCADQRVEAESFAQLAALYAQQGRLSDVAFLEERRLHSPCRFRPAVYGPSAPTPPTPPTPPRP